MKIRFRLIFLVLLVNSFVLSAPAQEVVKLYDGKRPAGSEILTKEERVRKNEKGEIITIRNVSMPTLTVYQPDNQTKNGSALIICPGGGFTGLAFQLEGTKIAEWCNNNGITAFILKYRLMPLTPEVVKAQESPGTKFDSIIAPYVDMAVADGREAVKYVRQHASEYGIDTARIGMMGFSAGGTVVGSVAQTYDAQSRPDFVAPIYAYCNAMLGDSVPYDAPPMFQTLATNDHIAFGNPELYEKWRDAGKSVEMHCFFNGGHGFGMTKRGVATDRWADLFLEWLKLQKFVPYN